MSHQPWIKFYPRDWRGDQALRLVSLSARGLWMEMLCVMHEASPYGHLLVGGQPVGDAALARLVGTGVEEVQALLVELRTAGVFRQTRGGVVYSKRMTDDHKRSVAGRKAKEAAIKEAAEKEEENPLPSRVPSRGPPTQKPEARKNSVPDGTGGSPPDPNKEAWDRAIAILRSKARMSDASARTFFGKLLSEFRLEGRDLLAAVVKAEGLTEEPKAYLRKCAAWIAQRRGGDHHAGSPEDRVASWSDDIWDKAVEAFRETGRWSEVMGPEPGDSDCKAPRSVLAKHGYHRSAA